MVLHNLLHSDGYNFQDVLSGVYGTLCRQIEISGGPLLRISAVI